MLLDVALLGHSIANKYFVAAVNCINLLFFTFVLGNVDLRLCNYTAE